MLDPPDFALFFGYRIHSGQACDVAKTEGTDMKVADAEPGEAWYFFCAALLGLYVVLVPYVLFVWAELSPPEA